MTKLVRDRIPQIVKESGKECVTTVVEGEEKFRYLEEKLKEEVNEFLEDKNLEELADVMEVLFGLAEELGYSNEDLLKARIKKLYDRGGFEKGIVLEEVIKN